MELANVSAILVYAAIVVYLVALISFAVDVSSLGAGASPKGQRRGARIGITTTWLGTTTLLAAIVVRGLATSRAPWANMYEFTLVTIFFLMAIFVIVGLRRDVRFLGLPATLVAVLSLWLAVAVLYVQADGIPPSLRTYWLIVHVLVAMLSTGLLAFGALTAVLHLYKHYVAPPEGQEPATRLQRLATVLPSTDDLERWTYRSNAVGFVTWTFTIIAGAIWAEHAWGRPWGWDAKEVSALIVWLVYAAYLHVRATVGWAKHKYAFFVLVGVLALIYNFWGVNLLFGDTSLHAYSGL